VNFLLRAFSFLFHLPLTLFFLGLGSFALLEGAYDLNLPMLPWSGRSLTFWIFGLSLAGLFSIYLALRKKARMLYVLYALTVFGLAIYWVFFSTYRFDGAPEFRWALVFVAAALVAALGAMSHARHSS
jgi:apolipoprotein N-acyltransferase